MADLRKQADVKTVPLYGKKAAGRVALVDDEDYELVSQYRWHIWERPQPGGGVRGPYAQANRKRWGKKSSGSIRMHVLIMGRRGIDHENHDGLDNRRANLRDATVAQNQANRRPNAQHSSRFKGVYLHTQHRKWVARIRVDGHTRHIGIFADEVAAALAYDSAAQQAWGDFANLNFPRR